MRIEIQYLRHYDHGVRQTLELDINPECLVSDLKIKINSHIKIAAAAQELYIQMYGKFELMGDELSLNFYQIKEGQKISLKVLNYVLEQSAAAAPKAKQKKEQQLFQQRSKKFFDKIGLFNEKSLAQLRQTQQAEQQQQLMQSTITSPLPN